jgi:hypothetical protein
MLMRQSRETGTMTTARISEVNAAFREWLE